MYQLQYQTKPNPRAKPTEWSKFVYNFENLPSGQEKPVSDWKKYSGFLDNSEQKPSKKQETEALVEPNQAIEANQAEARPEFAAAIPVAEPNQAPVETRVAPDRRYTLFYILGAAQPSAQHKISYLLNNSTSQNSP